MLLDQKNNFIIFIMLITLITLLVFSINKSFAIGQTNSAIVHFPVTNATEGQSVLIEVRIEDPNIRIHHIRLYYRQKGQSNFQFVDMEEQLNSYVAEIPGSAVKLPAVEYFIMAVLNNRSMLTSPATNPYYAPYEIVVSPVTGGSAGATTPQFQPTTTPAGVGSATGNKSIEAVILSPEPSKLITPEELVIAVSFLGAVDSLDLHSVKLFIDGHDFTGLAEVTKNLISYLPEKLSVGSHRAKVQFADIAGNQFDDVEWQFSVVSSRTKTASEKSRRRLYGSAFAEWKSDKFADSTLTNSSMGANFRGSYGAINYRGKLYLTSREKPDFQPRNRLLLEAGTSWLGIKLGDTTPRFNDLMLWGRRVRGFEAYLKLGFINLEFVTGETNRRIRGIPYDKVIDPATGRVTYLLPGASPDDSTAYRNSTTGIYRYGTFRQNLMAGRISFGSGNNFQLGLNLVKVKDDTSASTYGSQPKDNLVVGPDILLALDHHRLEFKASAAFSLLANDISDGAVSQSDLDSTLGELPFDPAKFEKYFILNLSLIPLDPRQLNSLAYQASFKFNYFNNNLNIFYKSIGSEYYSLANNYLRKDIRGFSIYDRIHLYHNRIFLNLGYDRYLEGISKQVDDQDNTEPVDYAAVTIGVSFFPAKKFLPRVNINWKKFDRNDGLDTTINYGAVNYQNSDISLQLGYDVQLFDLNHTFSINYITNDRVDGFHRTYTNLANDIRMYSLRTIYNIPLTTVLSFATNRNNAAGGRHAFQYNMVSFSGNYSLLNRRLTLRGGVNLTSAVRKTNVDSTGAPTATPITAEDYKRLAFNMGGRLQIATKHSLLVDMSFINFDDKKSRHYQDSIIRFRYEFRY